MGQIEKAYYLRNLEFAVLLSLKGVSKLYGLKMNDISTAEASVVYNALFEMEKKRLITIENKKNIKIEQDLDKTLESIKNADRMLLYMNMKQEHYEQCVYMGEKAVFVSSYGIAGGINHIESREPAALPTEICERGFYIEGLLENINALGEGQTENAELEARADELFKINSFEFADGLCEGVSDCLRVYVTDKRQCIKQYLLMKDRLDDYFIVTDKDGSSVFMYSRQRVLDTLSRDFSI